MQPAIVKTRFANGPEDGLCRPKHVAPLNLSKLNKLDVLDVKCLSFNNKQLYLCDTWHLLFCMDDQYAGWNVTHCIPESHPYRKTSTKCHINTVVSLDDGHMVAQNMYRKEMNILRKIVHQVDFIYKIIQGCTSQQNLKYIDVYFDSSPLQVLF